MLLVLSFTCHTPLIVGMKSKPTLHEPSSSSSSSLSSPSSSSLSSLENKHSEDSESSLVVDYFVLAEEKDIIYFVAKNDLTMTKFLMGSNPLSPDKIAEFIGIASNQGHLDMVKYLIEFAREKVPARLENPFYMAILNFALEKAHKAKRHKAKRIDVINLIKQELSILENKG